MITEDYVSFESAKLLKEKGFDAECDYLYADGKLVRAQGYACNWNDGETLFADYKNECSAPTLQMAMKWLREVYNIIIDVSPLSFNTKGSESFICNNWVFTLWENGNPIVSEFYGNQTAYPTYEETCESAIKCGLENLIKIG